MKFNHTTDNFTTDIPTTDNTTAEFNYTTQYIVITTTLFLVCAFLVVGANALVVFSFLCKHIPRTFSNFYMFQLAIADGAIGVSLPVNLFSSIVHSLSKSTHYCTFETLMSVCCMMASTLCIFGLTLDRLQALKYSLQYSAEMTTRRYIVSTLFIWFLPVTIYFMLPMIWYNDLEDTPLKTCYTLYIMKREFTAYILLPGVFISFSAVVAMYVPILTMAFRHSRAIRAITVDSNQADKNMKSQLQIMKTAIMVLCPYFVGWMPWCFLATSLVYDVDEYNHPGIKFKVMQYLAYPVILISAVNPIVYAARMPEYRKAFRALLGCNSQVSPITPGT